MSKFYLFLPLSDTKENYDFYFDNQRKAGHLSIGWYKGDPFGKEYEDIKKEIEALYPDFKGTNKPDNIANSLLTFCNLNPGDVLFVRGDAKIIDVALITGNPLYQSEKNSLLAEENYALNGDHRTQIPFVPLFEKESVEILTSEINKESKELYEIFDKGGPKLVLKEISEKDAKGLFEIAFKAVNPQLSPFHP